MIKKDKTKKAFSLIEMLVTMAIFALIIAMLLQSLLLNIKLTTQINLRSKFNTELDQLVSLIERDIRNADYFYPSDKPLTPIMGCGPLIKTDCTLSLDSNNFKWYLLSSTCIPPHTPPSPCGFVKRDKWPNSGGIPLNDFTSSSYLDITMFEFYVNSGEQNEALEFSKANILVTIKAKPSILSWETDYGIKEQVRQISVSTRNYEIKL